MKCRAWIWRTRSNPLRRRSYAVEAWAFLLASLIAVAGSVLVGTWLAHDLEGRYAQQRLERHNIGAVLTQDAPAHYGATRVDVPGRWTAPDGAVRTGIIKAGPGTSRGAVVQIWTDDRGDLAAKPLSSSIARFQADVLAGAAAFGVFAGVMLGCVVTAKVVDRRRSDRWAADWAAADARWGHRNV